MISTFTPARITEPLGRPKMSKRQTKVGPARRKKPLAQELCSRLGRITSTVSNMFVSLISTKHSKSFPNLTQHAAAVRVYAETQQPPLAVRQERRCSARVAGKTNLQFSLSIQEPPVNSACPLETEQTAVKMFKRLGFLRYLCS